MRKEVMVKAVEMAKKMEGDWIARMALALKAAWAIVRKDVKRPIEILKDKLEESFSKPTLGTDLSHLTFNIWEKYGKSRIYVNAATVNGYFDFDQDGNIQKWYFDCGYNFDVRNELNATAELIKMGEF